jgi:hypothetical protein
MARLSTFSGINVVAEATQLREVLFAQALFSFGTLLEIYTRCRGLPFSVGCCCDVKRDPRQPARASHCHATLTGGMPSKKEASLDDWQFHLNDLDEQLRSPTREAVKAGGGSNPRLTTPHGSTNNSSVALRQHSTAGTPRTSQELDHAPGRRTSFIGGGTPRSTEPAPTSPVAQGASFPSTADNLSFGEQELRTHVDDRARAALNEPRGAQDDDASGVRPPTVAVMKPVAARPGCADNQSDMEMQRR